MPVETYSSVVAFRTFLDRSCYITSSAQCVCVCVLGGRLKAFKSVDCENLTSACSSYELLMCCPYIVSAVSLTLA